jgi:predicted nucleotidyltransferase
MTGTQGATSSAGEALLRLPESVARPLNEFTRAVSIAFGPDLQSIVLFGSAAEGATPAGSDVNVIVLLNNFKGYRADQAREALRRAQTAIPLRAMFLLVGEVDAAASAFANKFADVARNHVVLYGSDPFSDLQLPHASKVIRLKQVLMNSVVQLREAYVERSHDEAELAIVIADASGTLRSAAATLLILEGINPSELPRTSSIKASSKSALQRVARELGEDSNYFSAPLQGLATAREERQLPPGVAVPTLLGLIELVSRMRARADLLK